MISIKRYGAQSFALLLSFFIGIGSFKVVVPVGIAFSIIFLWNRKFDYSFLLNQSVALYAIVALFLFSYWFFYDEDFPSRFVLEHNYFLILSLTSAMVLILPYAEAKIENNAFNYVWSMSFGMLTFAVLTVLISVILRDPPHHGQIVDIRDLLRGSIKVGNTPGIASLLVFFPTTFVATYILPNSMRPRYWVLFGILGSVASLLSAIVIEQRSYFVVIFFILPTLFSLFMISRRKFLPCILIFTLLLTYQLLIIADGYFGYNIVLRKVDLRIFSDPRFEIFSYWYNSFLQNPWLRIPVGPSEWNSLQHFHNFFADVHRLSGLPSLIMAVLLIVWIFYRLVVLYCHSKEIAGALSIVAIVALAISITSVVPEGEKQPFFILILIASICERILWKLKEKLH